MRSDLPYFYRTLSRVTVFSWTQYRFEKFSRARNLWISAHRGGNGKKKRGEGMEEIEGFLPLKKGRDGKVMGGRKWRKVESE